MRVDVPPMTAPRPRFTGGHAYTPAEYREWKRGVAMILRTHTDMMRVPDGGKAQVVIRLQPSGFDVDVYPLETESRRGGLRGDVDNYAKGILDSLQEAGVFRNDSQVEFLTVVFDAS